MDNKNSSSENKTKQHIYVDGIWIKQRIFNDGASILNVSILVKKFSEFIEKHKKQDGFVNFIIRPRREIKENGESHYAYLASSHFPRNPLAKEKVKKIEIKEPESEAQTTPNDEIF